MFESIVSVNGLSISSVDGVLILIDWSTGYTSLQIEGTLGTNYCQAFRLCLPTSYCYQRFKEREGVGGWTEFTV